MTPIELNLMGGKVRARAPGGPWLETPLPTLRSARARLVGARTADEALALLEATPDPSPQPTEAR